MGSNIGMIAVKKVTLLPLLTTAQLYYDKFDLKIKQEVIAGKKFWSSWSNDNYDSIKNYDEKFLHQTQNQDLKFCTNFDMYFDLLENSEWTVFMYNQKLANKTLNINQTLSQTLSKIFETTVIEHITNSSVNDLGARIFQNGNSLGHIRSLDSELQEAEGIFKPMKATTYETFADLQASMQEQLSKWGFNFGSRDFSPINDEKYRHPMYLSGQSEKIIDFLQRVQPSEAIL